VRNPCRGPNVCAKLLVVVVPDELRVERLRAPERLAVASITGIAENCTLHDGRTDAEGHAAIDAHLGPHPDDRRRLILSHAVASYVGGEYPYQRACVALLAHHGADLELALHIAIHRTGRPNTNLGNAERRRRLLTMRAQGDRRE
jgi:hypothetical protein